MALTFPSDHPLTHISTYFLFYLPGAPPPQPSLSCSLATPAKPFLWSDSRDLLPSNPALVPHQVSPAGHHPLAQASALQLRGIPDTLRAVVVGTRDECLRVVSSTL